jgi:hypothetical protein
MGTPNHHHEDEFSLSDTFDRAVRYWWLSALLMITGGLIGLLISVVQKPVYESTSVITTVIDFAYAGRLTNYEEDHLLTAVGDVIRSSEVMSEVTDAGVEAGLAPTVEAIRASLTASRQGYRWELSSRSANPATAMEINRLWLDAAVDALEHYRMDSILALSEFNFQVEVENCFQQAVVVEPVSAFCSVKDLQALRDQVNQLESSSERATLLSRLLTSRISFQVTRQPEIPVEPVHLGRGISVAAGVLLGLLVAILLLVLGLPRHRSPEK